MNKIEYNAETKTLKCVCGTHIPTDYRLDAPDVKCTCGKVYSFNGYLRPAPRVVPTAVIPVARYVDGWYRVDTIYSSTYASQGFGAVNYAKGAAERLADAFRAQNIPVEVREAKRATNPGGRGWRGEQLPSTESCEFQVWAQCDHDKAQWALNQKTDFVEVVRLCWKRGVNPRVYYPFLPVGFEEKNGLDFFGNKK
jgi:hypothetical protein